MKRNGVAKPSWKARKGDRADNIFVKIFGNGGDGGRGGTDFIDWRGAINARCRLF